MSQCQSTATPPDLLENEGWYIFPIQLFFSLDTVYISQMCFLKYILRVHQGDGNDAALYYALLDCLNPYSLDSII